VPVSHAKFDMNRCNESPLWGVKPDFWPVSKLNTGSLPLRGIPPVKIIHQSQTEIFKAKLIQKTPKKCQIAESKLSRPNAVKKTKFYYLALREARATLRHFPVYKTSVDLHMAFSSPTVVISHTKKSSLYGCIVNVKYFDFLQGKIVSKNANE